MTEKTEPGQKAEVLDEQQQCTLEELCISCNVEEKLVMELVEHGALEPAGRSLPEFRFTRTAVVRVSRAKRLMRDLDLNTPGVALALELLDEIDTLRARLRAIETGR
jgi:chaperone modulatory protein CbpM